jgi:hypothetical protein
VTFCEEIRIARAPPPTVTGVDGFTGRSVARTFGGTVASEPTDAEASGEEPAPDGEVVAEADDVGPAADAVEDPDEAGADADVLPLPEQPATSTPASTAPSTPPTAPSRCLTP